MKKNKFIYILSLLLIFSLLTNSVPALVYKERSGLKAELDPKNAFLEDSVFSKDQASLTNESDKSNQKSGENQSTINNEKFSLNSQTLIGEAEKEALFYDEINNEGVKGSTAEADDEELSGLFKPASFTSIDLSVAEKDMQKISSGKAIKDSLKKRDEKKYYILNVSSRGYIELEFLHDGQSASATPSWKTYLYERYYSEGTGGKLLYRELTILNSINDNVAATSNRVGVYPGTYVVMVTNTSSFSTAAYNLKANFVETNDYEAEYNDSVYRYNKIYSGRPIKGSSSLLSEGKDIDYFMFEMNKNGYVELSFTHADFKLPSVAWRITLYDEQGRVLYADRSSTRDTENLSGAIGLKKGIYFVVIASHEYYHEEYTLCVDITANNNYEAEPNDSFEMANTLSNKKTIKGSVSLRSSPMERDFFKINMPKNGYLQVFFKHEGPKREIDWSDKDGWNIYIYNSKKEVIFADIATWYVHELTSPKIGLPAGDYYICLDAEGRHHNPVTYSIMAEYVSTNDWEIEDNNSHASANPISIGQSIHGSLVTLNLDYDVDYFVFEVEKTMNICYDFEHKKIAGNEYGWLVSLLGANLQELTSLKSKWSDEYKTSSQKKLLPGKYYIKVDIDNGMSFNSEEYRITLREAQ